MESSRQCCVEVAWGGYEQRLERGKGGVKRGQGDGLGVGCVGVRGDDGAGSVKV